MSRRLGKRRGLADPRRSDKGDNAGTSPSHLQSIRELHHLREVTGENADGARIQTV